MDIKSEEQRTAQILNDIEACFRELGLKPERKAPGAIPYSAISCELPYEHQKIVAVVIYFPSIELIDMAIHYGLTPREQLYRLIQLINHINTYLVTDHLAIDPDSGGMLLHTGIFVTRDFLEKEQFKRVMEQLMEDSFKYIPLLSELLNSNRKPKAIMESFVKKQMKLIDDLKKEIENEEKEEQIVE